MFALQRTDPSRSARSPLFAAKLVRWSEHPVLSKPPMIRGIIPTDGSPGCRAVNVTKATLEALFADDLALPDFSKLVMARDFWT